MASSIIRAQTTKQERRHEMVGDGGADDIDRCGGGWRWHVGWWWVAAAAVARKQTNPPIKIARTRGHRGYALRYEDVNVVALLLLKRRGRQGLGDPADLLL